MTIPTPHDARRRNNWAALHDSAIDLVSRLGFAAVTVDDIAAGAGVSRRTFFNHFDTKAAALFDAPPDDADRLAELLRKAVPDEVGAWQALREVCLAYVQGSESVLAVHRQLVDQGPEMVAQQRTAYAHTGVALKDWMHQQHSNDPLLANLMVETATGLLLGAFLTWRPGQDPSMFYDYVARGFDVLGDGFCNLTT
jgi:AcrR family transcriptional regulator